MDVLFNSVKPVHTISFFLRVILSRTATESFDIVHMFWVTYTHMACWAVMCFSFLAVRREVLRYAVLFACCQNSLWTFRLYSYIFVAHSTEVLASAVVFPLNWRNLVLRTDLILQTTWLMRINEFSTNKNTVLPGLCFAPQLVNYCTFRSCSYVSPLKEMSDLR